MILKQWYKGFVYTLLACGIVCQLIGLSLYSPYRQWLSPVLFKISHYYLARFGLNLYSAQFQIDPRGIIRIQEAICYTDKQCSTAVSLKEAQLSLHPTSFRHPLQGSTLSLQELSVYHKSQNPSCSEAVFTLKGIHCTLKDQLFFIDQGCLTYSSLKLNLGGVLDFKKLFSKRLGSPIDLEPALAAAQSFKKQLEYLYEPLGWAYFELDAAGSHLSFVMGANDFQSEAQKTYPRPYAKGVFHFYEQQAHTALVHFQWPKFETRIGEQHTLTLEAISGGITWPDASNLGTLKIDAFGESLSIDEDPFLGYWHASVKNIKGPWIDLNLHGVDDASWIIAQLQMHIQDQALVGTVRANVKDVVFKKKILSAYFPENSYLKEGLSLEAKLALGPKYCFQSCEGSMRANNCCLIAIPLDSLRANFIISPQYVAITQADFKHPNCTGEGAYYQNLLTSDYRFLLKGSLNPHLITPVMDPWWKELWADFDLSHAWPTANVDVQGNWSEQSTSFVYGYATSQSFSFRNAFLDSCSLYFWATPLYLQLFDLNLVYHHQKAEVLIDWMYAPQDLDNYYAIAFDAKSELSLDTLALLLAHEDVKGISRSFQCTVPPSLEGRGILYGKPAVLQKDHMRLQCKIPHALSYEGVHLDYLSFDVHKKGPTTAVSSLHFGLAGGKAQGSLILGSHLSGKAMNFDLSLDAADYDALRKFTQYKDNFRSCAEKSQVQASASTLPAQDAEVIESSPIGGLASIQAKGKGELGDFNSFIVDGKFKLKGAHLGQIHMLGQLSKSLKVGSFDFKNLKADFSLEAGLLKVPNLNIWGNTARMQGKGEYSLVQDALDFSLHFYALGGLKLPVFSQLFRWIDPVSKVSFIKLQGSLEEPEWKIKLSPFAFLK